MLQLMNFQRKHLNTLEDKLRDFRSRRNVTTSPVIELTSPTGSGKTIMLSHIIRDTLGDSCVLFLSPGSGSLDDQTRRSLRNNLDGEAFTVSDVTMETFKHPATAGTVIVKNWESFCMKDKKTLDYKNRFVRANEQGNLFSWIHDTVSNDVPVVIMIDESHYGKGSDQSKINDFLNDVKGIIIDASGTAPVIIEASATPISQSVGNPLHYMEVISYDEARTAGLLRSYINLNGGTHDDYDTIADFADADAETYLLERAYATQNDLIDYYREMDDTTLPLLCVQLSNGKPSLAALERIRTFWADKGITEENGQLFVYMSSHKTDVLNALNAKDSNVRVLIYKQAISLGWNCPRAQILVGFRHTKSKIFEIQNIGRFLRTTHGRTYTDVDSRNAVSLNTAYIYTNERNMTIERDLQGLSYLQQGLTTIQRMVVASEYDEYINEYNTHHFPTSFSKRIVKVNRKREVSKALSNAIKLTGFSVEDHGDSENNLLQGITDVSTLDTEGTALNAEETGTGLRTGATEIDERLRSIIMNILRGTGRMPDVADVTDKLIQRLLLRLVGVLSGSVADYKRILVQSDNRDALIKLVQAFAADELFDPIDDEEPVSAAQSRLTLTGSHQLPKHIVVQKNVRPLGDYMVGHALYRDESDEHVAYRIDGAAPSGPEKGFESMMLAGSDDYELVSLQKLPTSTSDITFSLGIHLMVNYDDGGTMRRTNFFPDYHVFLKSKRNGSVKPVLVEIKGSTAHDSPEILKAKSCAAEQYTRHTGLPFIVLQETGTGTGEFYKYNSPGVDLDTFMNDHEHDDMLTFTETGTTEDIPDDLRWMETLGIPDTE